MELVGDVVFCCKHRGEMCYNIGVVLGIGGGAGGATDTPITLERSPPPTSPPPPPTFLDLIILLTYAGNGTSY